MKDRERFSDRKQPISIYETSLSKWKNAAELVKYLKNLKYTHVEPVSYTHLDVYKRQEMGDLIAAAV